ncbi:MAG TPA: sortase [Candidatus Woesebacteria bacterium]|nr:sortase [Candidatus Woesebacteria bacterium]HNS94933.1 sortase [Candidatus Woesebacteria bacterium]
MNKAQKKVQESDTMQKAPPWPLVIAIISIVSGLGVLMFVFTPILWLETQYVWRTSVVKYLPPNTVVSPTPDPRNALPIDFSIAVPKIGAYAPVVKDVDAFDSRIYQQALSKGVAHAAGTSTPDKAGNSFLFAHSAQNIFDAGRYNAIFYLIDKLEGDDEFSVYYEGSEYIYRVREKRVVDAQDISIMEDASFERSVTLMTCWPAGTTWKRLIVVGQLQKVTSL